MEIISCKNLTIGYDGRKVLSGIDFTVCKGDYLCIFGENGAGKTTLMKTILGLLPPVSGTVIYGDGLMARPGRIGYMPQQSLIQRDFPASVSEIVLSGNLGKMSWKPFYGPGERKRAEAAMSKLGILSLKKRSYRELSGGQQQRVLLARALCAAEELLLLDEPVSGLDPAATDELYRTLLSLNRDSDITIIMITHDPEAALRNASHVLRIGDAAFFGTTAAYTASQLYRR